MQKRFPDGVPLLDPVDDMGIKDPALKKVIQKVEAFEHRMYSHPLHSDPNLESVYSLCEKKALVRKKRINVKPFLTDAFNKKSQLGFGTIEILIILIFHFFLYWLPLLDTNQQPSIVFSCQTGRLWPYILIQTQEESKGVTVYLCTESKSSLCCIAHKDHTSCDFCFPHFIARQQHNSPAIAGKQIIHTLSVELILFVPLQGNV